MSTVRDIIRKKGSDVWSIAPDATVYDALQLMAEKGAGALLVMTGDEVNGILSERDCVRRVDLLGRTSRNTKVNEIMTSEVISVQVTEKLEDCMTAMIEKKHSSPPGV
jgi:CBS domain-containing protein